MPVLKVKNGGTWINVSGGSGASVQSDWTINDETNPAHIKNRPFYEEPNVWVSLLPSTEFGPFYISPMFGIPIYDRDATYDLIVGETYRITWDGVAYECIAQDISSVLPGGVGVGNGTNFGLAGNNEPFIVCILNGAEGYISLTETEAGGSHTVSVEEIGTVIHKVDSKYLPDEVAFKEDIPEVPSQIVNTVNGMTGDVVINIPEAPVTSVNGMTGDVTIEIPESPVTSVNGQTGDVVIEMDVSWNDLTNKPFEPEVVYYEWDEDVIYDTVVTVEGDGEVNGFARISEDSPDSDFFVGKTMIATNALGNTGSIVLSSDGILNAEGGYMVGGGGTAGLIVVQADSLSMGQIEGTEVILTKGVWSLDGFTKSDASTPVLVKVVEPAKTIDESVIPDTIARTNQIEHFTYGTEDLVAGTSELATGKLYFVYE